VDLELLVGLGVDVSTLVRHTVDGLLALPLVERAFYAATSSILLYDARDLVALYHFPGRIMKLLSQEQGSRVVHGMWDLNPTGMCRALPGL
jgi:hypothetical protein